MEQIEQTLKNKDVNKQVISYKGEAAKISTKLYSIYIWPENWDF